MRIAVLAVSALVALTLAAVLAAWLLIRTDWAMGRLEDGLVESLRMDVRVGQPARFGLLPGVTVTLSDIEVSKEGQVVGTAETGIVLAGACAAITDGSYNFHASSCP